MINISFVSYSNTLPFKNALENSEFITSNAILNELNPADCALSLLNNDADIALVPIGALPLLKDYKIISDFCLSANKKVESVLLLSACPRSEIKEIILDYQSMTSVKLIKILAENHWKKAYSYSDTQSGFEKYILGTTAAVIIGDRALNLRNSFPFVYDLAEEWFDFTGLPMVFAVWVANKAIDESFLNNFNKVLKLGVENIPDLALKNSPLYDNFDLLNYLTNSMSYNLNQDKFLSIERFLDLLKKLS